MSKRRAASEDPPGRRPITEPQALRTHLLKRRRKLAAVDVRAASLRIVSRLVDDPRVRRAARAGPVGLYWPVRGEADVRPLPGGDSRMLGEPHGLTLPGHPGRRPRMLRWEPGASLVTAWTTLRYPPDGAAEVAPGDHGLILVPGVAFDPAGNRLGSGGGWYDRLLAGLGGSAADCTVGATPLLIGVAHEFQMVEHLTAQPWDVPMHLVATPAGLISGGD